MSSDRPKEDQRQRRSIPAPPKPSIKVNSQNRVDFSGELEISDEALEAVAGGAVAGDIVANADSGGVSIDSLLTESTVDKPV